MLNSVRVEKQQQITPPRLEEFHLKLDAEEPLRELKAAGYILLATTNQPGIAHGTPSRREVDMMHALLQKRLGLDGVLLCPHDPDDDCCCRKPKTGLITEAAFKWHLDLDRSFVVSDKWQDAQAAHVAGCTSILIKSVWNGSGHHDSVVSDLTAAVNKILLLQPTGLLRVNCAAV